MRPRQLTLLAFLVFLAFCAYSLLRFKLPAQEVARTPAPIRKPPTERPPAEAAPAAPSIPDAPLADRKPKPAAPGPHPIWHLMKDAEDELEGVKARQSKTLQEAVAEYRSRYGIPPPPHFDKWYAFAKKKKIQLIDEFDTIHELITPFWGLKPATIRARAQEALGFGNSLLGIQIRNGKITNVDGGTEWMQTALQGMMKPFLQHLPSMDLCFNIHDEPRVVVPHEDMARLVNRAKTIEMPAANAVVQPKNAFTKPKDLNAGDRFDETKLTRFNVFPHQPTWTHSRMSCPPSSPARELEESDRTDAVGRYGLSELGFVYNETAMSDVCLSPSLSSTYGFFDRPNAFSIVHDLFPIFSQSKISSFADILYPSPWYWFEKVAYDEGKDVSWSQKTDALYWRGSTTGGFSRNGGWRRQHRQRFVQKINAADQAKILVNRGDDAQPNWQVKEVPRGDYKNIIDVYFSHIGQCDPGDCTAQRQFFEVQEHADQQDAWHWKHLLDIDGNAFSGRFYAFLHSRSLVYKFAVFREWHFEWLKPWAHYIPLSIQGDDWLEAVRFFSGGDSGKKEAERLAMQGRDWANKVLRKEDMEVWFFRLLLEYGRVIDDDRDNIGFTA